MADDRIKNLPFSESVRVGNTVYVAGLIGFEPGTTKPPADVREEARLALNGLRDVLGRQGLTMDDLVMVNVHAPNAERDYAPFNEVYVTYFNGAYPARAFVGSGPLLFGARFEVTAIAAWPKA